ncbi:MAG: Unknown protein [uncultured Sulfurovum sp.]|uniref:Lipoprotein n=1 Tax=uncultured Sulfurovum sp. TaxID=269237 RepID=A0A6S6RZS5_9BACT|nr:MAG: Unknown protein [uncultured Sulfurovum sp.]
MKLLLPLLTIVLLSTGCSIKKATTFQVQKVKESK